MATYTIEVNGRPVPGSCGITSYEGSALVDQFSVFCFGWEDIDVPLTYTFKERPVGTSDWRIFHSGIIKSHMIGYILSTNLKGGEVMLVVGE